MQGRVKHIDIARGISITLVALFHSHLAFFIPQLIEPMALFRMPLFFLLSGIFFTWTDKTSQYFIKKSDILLKPYFSILLLLFIVSIFTGEDDLLGQLFGIFYGNGSTIKWVPLWYLTHIFIVYCFVFLLFKLTNMSTYSASLKVIILSLFILIGAYQPDFFWNQNIQIFSYSFLLPGLPFSLDIILLTSTYFIIGSFLRSYLINFKPSVFIFIFCIFVFLYIATFTNSHIDLNTRVYDNPLFATLGALSGIYILITISYNISKNRLLRIIPLKLGKSSLYILIFHIIIGEQVYNFLSQGVSSESTLFLLSIIAFSFSIFVPLIIKQIIESNQILSFAFLPSKSNT
jgi:fucose 4-O-acetylase-like acetyltransferase